MAIDGVDNKVQVRQQETTAVQQQETTEAQKDVSVWIAQCDNRENGGNADGKVDAKEMGLDKILKKVNKFLEKFEPSVDSKSRTFFDAIKSMSTKLAETINYQKDKMSEADLEKEITNRQNDANTIESLIQRAKKNTESVLQEYKNTEFKSKAANAGLASADKAHLTTEQEKKQAELNEKIANSFINAIKSDSNLTNIEQIDKSKIEIDLGIKNLSVNAKIKPKADGTANDTRDKTTGVILAKADVCELEFSYVTKDGLTVTFKKDIPASELPQALQDTKSKVRGSEVTVTQDTYDEVDIDDL